MSAEENLRKKHENTIKKIRQLEEIERAEHARLQEMKYNNTGTNSEDDIRERINNLMEIRLGELKNLTELYQKNQEDKVNAQKNLADNIIINDMVKGESKGLAEKIDGLKRKKYNKTRLAQISEYEYDRYNEHVYIFKWIFISLIISLVISFLPLQKNLKLLLIIVVIAVVLLFSGVPYNMWLNARRDNMDYDRFIQTYNNEFKDDQKFPSASEEGQSWKKLFGLETTDCSKCSKKESFLNYSPIN